MCFTVTVDLDSTRGRIKYNILFSVEFKLLRKWNDYVLLIIISLCYVVGLPTLAIGTPSTSTLE